MIPRILLVEDNAADLRLLQESIADEGIYVEVSYARSAEEALAMVESLPSGQLPDLVLLDLNLPRMSGRELLAVLKAGDRTRTMPIIVLTTSDREEDVDWCYAHGASSYVCKPMGFDDYGRLLHSLVDFYFRTARLPTRAPLPAAAIA